MWLTCIWAKASTIRIYHKVTEEFRINTIQQQKKWQHLGLFQNNENLTLYRHLHTRISLFRRWYSFCWQRGLRDTIPGSTQLFNPLSGRFLWLIKSGCCTLATLFPSLTRRWWVDFDNGEDLSQLLQGVGSRCHHGRLRRHQSLSRWGTQKTTHQSLPQPFLLLRQLCFGLFSTMTFRTKINIFFIKWAQSFAAYSCLVLKTLPILTNLFGW